MERLRKCLCFKTSSSLLFSTTRFFTKLPSRLWLKAKGYSTFGAKQATKKKDHVSLVKAKELCGEYGDIDIMWKIIHPNCSKDGLINVNCKRRRFSMFCFNPS